MVRIEFFEDGENMCALLVCVFTGFREKCDGVSVGEFVHAQFGVLFVVIGINPKQSAGALTVQIVLRSLFVIFLAQIFWAVCIQEDGVLRERELVRRMADGNRFARATDTLNARRLRQG